MLFEQMEVNPLHIYYYYIKTVKQKRVLGRSREEGINKKYVRGSAVFPMFMSIYIGPFSFLAICARPDHHSE